jgi:hypothetical protein
VDEDRQSVGDGRSNVLSGRDAAASAGADACSESLPPCLRRRLERCADDWLSECRAEGGSEPRRSGDAYFLPRLVVAVCVALAIIMWWPR